MSPLLDHGISLPRLLEGVDWSASPAYGELSVGGIVLDSRQVRSGDIFVALKGQRVDGIDYITEAVAAGAKAVLVDGAATVSASVPVIAVADLAAQLSRIAGNFYRHPSRDLQLTAITGTNGKTTVCQLLARLNQIMERPSAFIGTMGYAMTCDDQLKVTGLTTPDAIAVQRILAELLDNQASAVAMEVSSHALEQGRIAAVAVDTAVFTNLSHDHLDYHGDLRSYAAAKGRLFDHPELKRAVVNIDDTVGQKILANMADAVDCFSYSMSDSDADVYCSSLQLTGQGARAEIVTPWGQGLLSSSLLGHFNVSNLLAVIAVACSQGAQLPQVLAAIRQLRPVSGRMELIDNSAALQVVVDYAHTPDALEQALIALRPHCAGRLWCVFGCGGDRDNSKRPMMARIASNHADRVVVTSDNPRSEDPQQIIDQVVAGIDDPGSCVVRVDRAEAISLAIADAAPGDLVLVAGKGHEDYQLIGDQRLSFSDQACARLALRQREGGLS